MSRSEIAAVPPAPPSEDSTGWEPGLLDLDIVKEQAFRNGGRLRRLDNRFQEVFGDLDTVMAELVDLRRQVAELNHKIDSLLSQRSP